MIHCNTDLTETTQFQTTVFPGGHVETIAVTYEEFVCNLVKEMGGRDNNLAHMVLGIAGEAGEIVDAIKKKVIYDKPLDIDNIIEELGDLEFYMAGMRQLLGVSRKEVLAANVAKLGKRYADGYSDAAAIARADKRQEQAAEATDVYARTLKQQGKATAINLPAAAVAGTDDMAGLSKAAVKALDSLEPTIQVGPGTDNLPDPLHP